MPSINKRLLKDYLIRGYKRRMSTIRDMLLCRWKDKWIRSSKLKRQRKELIKLNMKNINFNKWMLKRKWKKIEKFLRRSKEGIKWDMRELIRLLFLKKCFSKGSLVQYLMSCLSLILLNLINLKCYFLRDYLNAWSLPSPLIYQRHPRD